MLPVAPFHPALQLEGVITERGRESRAERNKESLQEEAIVMTGVLPTFIGLFSQNWTNSGADRLHI